MMPLPPRCFAEVDDLQPGGVVALSEAEFRHLAQVRRQPGGSEVLLLNGKGVLAAGTLEIQGKRGGLVRLTEVKNLPPPAPWIRLCVGGLKNAAWEEVLRHAVELGVNELVWVGSTHAVAEVKADRSEAKLERWRERCRQACKQSANPWLPVLRVTADVGQALALQPAPARRLVAALLPETEAWRRALGDAGALEIWVGPEGDFTTEEMAMLRQCDAVPVSLGPRICRAETAALACLARVRLQDS